MVSAEGSNPVTGGDANAESAVSVSNLEKEYGSGDDAVQAVNGVSFDVERGTAVGILGPNGAGKTTTIKSLLSLIFPSEGNIYVEGINVHKEPKQAFRHMGAMLEGARNTYWRLTVRENLEIFSVIAGLDYRERGGRIDDLLEQFDIDHKADTVVRELSRGQKQKVSLATAMARDADVVVLDEPTLGLDVESSLELRRELRRLVEDDGITVLLCSHDMDVIQDVCDRVIIMNDGEIVADDTVGNLLDLFDTQAYEVTVEGELDDADRRRLETAFDLTDFDRRRGSTTFQAHVTGDDFYSLVESLRAIGAAVEAFDTVEPDLEEVFLRITDDEEDERPTETPVAQAASGGPR